MDKDENIENENLENNKQEKNSKKGLMLLGAMCFILFVWALIATFSGPSTADLTAAVDDAQNVKTELLEEEAKVDSLQTVVDSLAGIDSLLAERNLLIDSLETANDSLVNLSGKVIGEPLAIKAENQAELDSIMAETTGYQLVVLEKQFKVFVYKDGKKLLIGDKPTEGEFYMQKSSGSKSIFLISLGDIRIDQIIPVETGVMAYPIKI